jgi:hypothetical protein
MSRDPEGGDYPGYAFKHPLEFNRTMRWGHAHPTWTFHALPFLGNMYLRVVKRELPQHFSDEDVANYVSWEHKLTRQWCKWDNYLSMLDPYLSQAPTAFGFSEYADKKWYKQGVPLVFTTLHDAKKWDVTLKAIESASSKRGSAPKIYFWKSKWYSSPEELLADGPPCVV